METHFQTWHNSRKQRTTCRMNSPVKRRHHPQPSSSSEPAGTLTQRKLIPALYTLYAEDRLPPTFAMLGVARSGFGDAEPDAGFRAHLRQGAWRTRWVDGGDDALWERFALTCFTVRAITMIPPRTRSWRAGWWNWMPGARTAATVSFTWRRPRNSIRPHRRSGRGEPQPSAQWIASSHALSSRNLRHRLGQRPGLEPSDARGL